METPRGPESAPGVAVGDRARRFIEALGEAEGSGDAAALIALFADDAVLRSLLHDTPHSGADGARRFWHEYLASFRKVRSRFDRVREAGDLLILEWTSEATTRSGHEVSYRGVSLVEYDGDRIRDFGTYYDSAAVTGHDRRGALAH